MEQGLCRILNLILLFARKIVPGSKANSLINEPFYPLINNFHPISFPIIRPWICQLMIHSGWCYWKGVNEVGDMIIRGIRDHIRIACMLFFIQWWYIPPYGLTCHGKFDFSSLWLFPFPEPGHDGLQFRNGCLVRFGGERSMRDTWWCETRVRTCNNGK